MNFRLKCGLRMDFIACWGNRD